MEIEKYDRAIFTGSGYQPFFDHWQQVLELITEPFFFHSGHMPGKQAAKTWDSAQYQFSAEAAGIVAGIASNDPTSIAAVCLSAIHQLLARYAGTDTVVVNTPLYKLTSDKTYYAAEVPLCQHLDWSNTIRESLLSVKAIVANGYTYQNFPLEILNDESAHRQAADLSNVLFYCPAVHHDPGNSHRYDFLISMENPDKDLRLTVTYNTLLFNGHFVDAFLNHLETLILQYRDLAQPLHKLSCLSQAEQEYLMTLATSPVIAGQTADQEQTLVSLFEAQVQRTPRAIAVIFENEQLTYSELNSQANQLARYLRDNYDVQQQQRVGLLLERSPRMIIAMLAVLKAGAAYLPLDPRQPVERLQGILTQAQAAVLLLDSPAMQIAASLDLPVFVLDLQLHELQEAATDLHLHIDPSGLAYVIYTSGSTGLPKGVLLEHTSVVNTLQWRNRYYNLNNEHVHLQLPSYIFDSSVVDIFSALSSGGQLVLPLEQRRTDTVYLADLIKQCKVTHFVAVPSFYRMLLGELTTDLQLLKTITVAGEAVTESLLEMHYRHLPGVELINEYGPTENAVCSTAGRVLPGDHPVSLGRPIDNVQVYVLDQSRQLLPLGLTGEIYLAGKGLARGYLHQEQLTQEKFVDHPFYPGQKIYRTGDLGRWLPNGELEYLGRQDEQVKVRGYRIELGEIEHQLCTHPAVKQAVVLVHYPQPDEPALTAFLMSPPLSVEDLKNHLGRSLPAYMVPTSFSCLSEFPRTATGKIDKKGLLALSQTIEQVYVAPANELEKKLLAFFEQLLNKPVGVEDDFFDHGGHSLKATQLTSRIYKEFGCKVELSSVFRYPTVRALAEMLRDQVPAGYQSIPVLPPADFYPVSHAQKSFWMQCQFDEGALAYNIYTWYLVKGPLDIAALNRIFRTLLERHESLRTQFIVVDGEPKQKIQPADEIRFQIEEHDLRNSSNPISADDVIQNHVPIVFSLENAPLLSIRLYQLGDEERVFHMTMHHIISDGWSLEVLAYEAFTLYNAYVNGQDLTLKPLATQYKDYAAWQNGMLAGHDSGRLKKYWRTRLSTPLPVLRLPFQQGTQLPRNYKGAGYHFTIPQTIGRQLENYCQEQGVTMFMVITALLKVQLSALSGQEDIIIGTPISGRDHHELEDQIGYFLNTLALRDSVDGSLLFSDFLQNVKQTTLEAYQHQAYPYDLLVDDLNIARDNQRPPLFTIGISWQNYDYDKLANIRLEQVTLVPIRTENDVVKHDIWYFGFCKDGVIDLSIRYRTDLFSSEMIGGMAEDYVRLVDTLLRSTGSTVQELKDALAKEEHKFEHDAFGELLKTEIDEEF